MMKYFVPMTLAAILALTACASSTAPADEAGKTGETGQSGETGETGSSQPAEEAQTTPELTGNWKQSNSESDDAYQQATITADTITIEWVADGGDTTSIYWVGTFDAPTDANEPYTWTSARDAEATDSALLASTDDTKDFTFESDTVSYKVSALGTTTTVKLQKD